jgi:chitodextrinase
MNVQHAAGATLVAVLLAGCGGSSGSAPKPETATVTGTSKDADGVRRAWAEMIRLERAHEGRQVCDRYVTEGTVQTLDAFGGCAQALSGDVKVSATSPDKLKVVVKGDQAAVVDPADPDPGLAVYTRGHWRFDIGDLAAQQPPKDLPVPEAVMRSWPAKFCQARIGMTKPEIQALMGKPQLQTPAGFGSPEEWEWSAGRFHFHGFFGTDGRVRQLDIDELEMTQAEKLLLTCPARRQ